MTIKLGSILDATKEDRQDMLFASFCDIAALFCLAREAERMGASARVVDFLLSEWKLACVAAAQSTGKKKGLSKEMIDAVASTVQDDVQDVANLVRETLERME